MKKCATCGMTEDELAAFGDALTMIDGKPMCSMCVGSYLVPWWTETRIPRSVEVEWDRYYESLHETVTASV